MGALRCPLVALALCAAVALGGCGSDGGGGAGGASTSSAPGADIAAGGENGQGSTPAGTGQGSAAAGTEQGGTDGGSPAGGPVDKTPSPAPPIRPGGRAGSKEPAPGVPTHKGGDNSVQTYGVEASAAARAQAATVLQTYLDARAAGEWAKACFYLSPSTREQLEQLVGQGEGGADCAQAMKALSAGVSRVALRRGARIDEVLSLRVKGGSAFLLFNAPPATTLYEAHMKRENGAWKVDTPAPSALPV